MIYPYEKGQDRKKDFNRFKNQGEKKSYTHSNRHHKSKHQNNGL